MQGSKTKTSINQQTRKILSLFTFIHFFVSFWIEFDDFSYNFINILKLKTCMSCKVQNSFRQKPS